MDGCVCVGVCVCVCVEGLTSYMFVDDYFLNELLKKNRGLLNFELSTYTRLHLAYV